VQGALSCLLLPYATEASCVSLPTDFLPTASLAALRARAQLNAALREFFRAREVLEVETPMLSEAGTTDLHIESFSVGIDDQTRWLRTSPEFPHKRLLAAGVGAIYELGRVFRHGERSARHNPEFTLLEWYRPGFDLAAMMDETVALLRHCAATFNVTPGAEQRLSYRELFQRYVQLDPFDAPLAAMAALHPGFVGELDRDGWQQLTLSTLIEPQLPPDGLLTVYDFPATQCALARIRPGSPPVAQRFELYWGAMELANGYFELTDADEQHARFNADQRARSLLGRPCPAPDLRLVAALAHGLPDCAGVAIGVDRLLLKLLALPTLDAVLAFPAERA
jgi:elongation factor P--(R)-beta-lysine ligase